MAVHATEYGGKGKGGRPPKADLTALAAHPLASVEVAMTRPDIKVWRFGLNDLPVWEGPLIARLCEVWPHIPAISHRGRIRQWMGSNAHKLVRTDNCIGLARTASEEMDPRTIVEVIFLWYPADRQGYAEANAICHDFNEWCRALRGREVRYSGAVDWTDRAKLPDGWTHHREVPFRAAGE